MRRILSFLCGVTALLSAIEVKAQNRQTHDGAHNAYLAPGRSIDVRETVGLGRRFCGRDIELVSVEAGSLGRRAALSLVVDRVTQDEVDVRGQPDNPRWHEFQVGQGADTLCDEADVIKIFNTSNVDIYVGNLSVTLRRERPQPRPRQALIGCASTNGQRVSCWMGHNATNVELEREFSVNRCHMGRSWAPDFNQNVIVVDDGCHATFRVTYSD